MKLLSTLLSPFCVRPVLPGFWLCRQLIFAKCCGKERLPILQVWPTVLPKKLVVQIGRLSGNRFRVFDRTKGKSVSLILCFLSKVLMAVFCRTPGKSVSVGHSTSPPLRGVNPLLYLLWAAFMPVPCLLFLCPWRSCPRVSSENPPSKVSRRARLARMGSPQTLPSFMLPPSLPLPIPLG